MTQVSIVPGASYDPALCREALIGLLVKDFDNIGAKLDIQFWHGDGICPAKAITMKRKLPRIDRKKCIRCFCCQEFCPKGAMKVSRPTVAKLLNK